MIWFEGEARKTFHMSIPSTFYRTQSHKAVYNIFARYAWWEASPNTSCSAERSRHSCAWQGCLQNKCFTKELLTKIRNKFIFEEKIHTFLDLTKNGVFFSRKSIQVSCFQTISQSQLPRYEFKWKVGLLKVLQGQTAKWMLIVSLVVEKEDPEVNAHRRCLHLSGQVSLEIVAVHCWKKEPFKKKIKTLFHEFILFPETVTRRKQCCQNFFFFFPKISCICGIT